MGWVDFVVGFGKIVATSIEVETGGILGQVLGMVGSLDENEKDENAGELSPKEDLFGSGGVLFNPLPPEKIKNKPYACDVVYVKRGDKLVPIAYRDLRLSRSFPSGLKKGSVALAGYGGGFYSLDLTSNNSGSRKANIHVIYCPYDYDGSGVAGKAHSVILDPTSGSESVSITHGAGLQISMTESQGILFNISSDSWAQFSDGLALIQFPKIMLKGNVYLGAQAETAVPFLGDAAATPSPLPPSPSVFLSLA